MKNIIALRGIAKVGKTTSIRAFYDLLKEKYLLEDIVPNNPRRRKEIFTIVKLGDLIIGIASAGDTPEIVERQLAEFQKQGCDVIICACRTRGSFFIVKKYEALGYETDFIDVDEISDDTRKVLFNHFLNIIHLSIRKWLNKLQASSILLKGLRNKKEFYHLNTPVCFFFPEERIEEFKRGYNPEEEKGGFILFESSHVNDNIVFKATKIEWVENIAEDKKHQYRIKTPKHNTKEFAALNSCAFPVMFHTHPAPEGNLLTKSLSITKQLNTSDADKQISYQFYSTGETDLLLPDILVVGQTNFHEMLFIGVYNGYITPIDFAKYQKELTDKMMSKAMESYAESVESADSNLKKAGLILAGIASIAGLIFMPSFSIPLIASSQLHAMSTQRENIYFGITTSKDFGILVPKVTDKIISENEKILQEILERKKLLFNES